MTKKLHTCYNCKNVFFDAIYWFDSLYAENYEKRIIKPFCGPKCVQEWHEEKGVADWPIRAPKDYPKGDKWKPVQNIS